MPHSNPFRPPDDAMFSSKCAHDDSKVPTPNSPPNQNLYKLPSSSPMHQSLLAKDQLMEEFQEDDVLWSDGEHQDDDDTVLEKQPSTRQQARRKESAPVDIPPKARVGASRSWAPRCSFHDSYDNSEDGDYDDDDDDDDDFGNNSSDERIPPHIIVARRTSDKMAFSVCVGKGRTLKGRDLYRVRNAILRMTGFLER